VKFVRTPIEGVFTLPSDAAHDSRGSFVRLFSQVDFSDAGLTFRPAQVSLSQNNVAGTFRGMHYQLPPNDESKLVRVTRGAVYDVVADLRPTSSTYGQWLGRYLTARCGAALLIPSGCAHGFITLEDLTDVLYQIDKVHVPGVARGFRYDDPKFAIRWPIEPVVVSSADLVWRAH